MDFHAHTRQTEIIGVLGGNFRFDDQGFPTLYVECAYPCKVIRSTGIEVCFVCYYQYVKVLLLTGCMIVRNGSCVSIACT